MKILGIDTTQKTSSITIIKDQEILIEYNFSCKLALSSVLLSNIDYSLKSAGMELEEINLIGITNGPGLFTGIRVGLATVKGLNFDRNIPVVAECSLKALAYKIGRLRQANIISVIDAKRDELYVAGYQFQEQNMKEIISPRLINYKEIDQFKKYDEIIFTGTGVDSYYQEFKEIYPEAEKHIRTGYISTETAQLAYLNFKKGKFLKNIQQLLPLYIRKTDAEQ